MQGCTPDEDVIRQSGEITRKELITYKEFCALNISNGYVPTIDDNRMMWVITIEYSGQHMIGDTLRDNPIITTVFDAETGNMLEQISKGATISN